MNKTSVSTPKQVHAPVFKLCSDHNSDRMCQQFTHTHSGMVIYYDALSIHYCRAL